MSSTEGKRAPSRFLWRRIVIVFILAAVPIWIAACVTEITNLTIDGFFSDPQLQHEQDRNSLSGRVFIKATVYFTWQTQCEADPPNPASHIAVEFTLTNQKSGDVTGVFGVFDTRFMEDGQYTLNAHAFAYGICDATTVKDAQTTVTIHNAPPPAAQRPDPDDDPDPGPPADPGPTPTPQVCSITGATGLNQGGECEGPPGPKG